MHYSILTFTDDDPMYLGQMPLVQDGDSVRVEKHSGELGRQVGEDGHVDHPWGDVVVPLPETVDTTDPAQLAPLASYYHRPFGPSDRFSQELDEVYVFKVDRSDRIKIDDLEPNPYHERVTPAPVRSGNKLKLDRQYEWDDDVAAPDAVADSPPQLADASHVVGYHDEQYSYDHYTHIGISEAAQPPEALRDVLTRVHGIPPLEPMATPIEQRTIFSADDVFTDAELKPEAELLA